MLNYPNKYICQKFSRNIKDKKLLFDWKLYFSCFDTSGLCNKYIENFTSNKNGKTKVGNKNRG